MTAARTLLERARARGVKLATAESCTGGMVAAEITAIAGASEIFERGFVTYTNAAKQDLLGVREVTLDRFGAVSPDVAVEMAEGSLSHSTADIAIAVTGIAGPGGSEAKPEGRVCFALARRQGETVAKTMEFGALGRSQVRRAATDFALDLLLAALA